MIDDMARPRPKYLHREITRHGKPVWYARVENGKRVRIRAAYGTPEFIAEYDAAIAGADAKPAAPKRGADSLTWALDLYRQSSDWLALSKATRRQRDNIFNHVLAAAAHVPIADIDEQTVLKGYERRAATPAAARNFLEAMRGLMRWALKRELIAKDPTAGLKAVRVKSEGFPAWDESDLAKFRKRWPLGTRERVACDLLYYTGLRRGDASNIGRQHVRDGVARFTTEKTGEPVYIPIEPELAVTLAAGPCGDLTFIATAGGGGMTKESFGNWFSEACRAAGVRKSAHGLRKAGATRDAERGFTESELEAKYGWRGGQMASKYTRAMNRERLAVGAAARARQNNG